MQSRSSLRASDADRERVAERLRTASTEGRITPQELEDRLHIAFGARTYGELDPLVADLPGAGLPAGRSRYLPASSKTNGMAIASLVLGVFWMWGFGSLLALVFGLLARREIDRSGGMQSGRGMAVAGIALGLIGLLGAAALIGLSAVGFSHR